MAVSRFARNCFASSRDLLRSLRTYSFKCKQINYVLIKQSYKTIAGSGHGDSRWQCIHFTLTLLHFSRQLAVQSDHHFIVFSICAARARASSNSRCRWDYKQFENIIKTFTFLQPNHFTSRASHSVSPKRADTDVPWCSIKPTGAAPPTAFCDIFNKSYIPELIFKFFF